MTCDLGVFIGRHFCGVQDQLDCRCEVKCREELAWLVEAGLTSMEALQAATGNAALFMGRLDTLGTLEKGKSADMVLLDRNPLDDIRDTRTINAVVVRGKVLSKGDLVKLLINVEANASNRSKPALETLWMIGLSGRLIPRNRCLDIIDSPQWEYGHGESVY